MATTLKLRRGTTAQHATFTGALGEVTVDTDKDVVVVHDGSTAGGFPALRAGAGASVSSLTNSGNITFTGTGNRITGDFSNSTFANRVAFQTSTVNGSTAFGIIPNGTNSLSAFTAFSDSGATNSSIGQLRIDGTDVRVVSGMVGTGTYLPMTFYTGGSERMRVDTSGNVGIGTSSPVQKLHVVGIARATGGLQIAIDTDINFNSGADNNSRIGVNGGAGTTDYRGFNGHRFFTTTGSDTERARIDSSGNLLVGTTATDGRLVSTTSSATQRSIHAGSINGSTTTDGVYYGYVAQARGTGFNFMAFQNTSGIDFKILGNGNVQNTNNSYGAISDAKLKQNVVDATPKLEKLQQVRVVNYNLIGQEQKQIGVIAQELEQIFPSMIEETQDRDEEGNLLETTTKSVKYSVFVPMLIKAMQEQQAMIEELKAKVAALEEK
jgi:hypothetical protein